MCITVPLVRKCIIILVLLISDSENLYFVIICTMYVNINKFYLCSKSVLLAIFPLNPLSTDW